MEEDDSKAQAPTKLTIKDGRKPAEIFRTDLITAMKIPDHQLIPPDSYFDLTDPWKQEWERGVQVPVNMGSLPQPSFQVTESRLYSSSDFKMPTSLVKAETKKEKEKHVSYDLDDEDVEWLKALNRSRRNKGLEVVDEFLLEKAITCLEDQCYTNMGETISTEKGLSIEYDEDISCDVCRIPECEDGNEIIFCDVCNVAVHQACYGVQKVPVGSWVCRPCAQLLSNSPCLLCPTRGGAMKRTKSKGYNGWIHMSCALWIPEVGIGDVEKMEPITRIEAITPGRWNLLCCICKERKGACIQCSVKTCVTAFHVTCGFDNNLEMQTVLDESAPDGVRHVCYCYKHGPKRGNKSPRKSPHKSPRKPSTGTTNSPRKVSRRPSCASPQKSAARQEEEQENMRQRRLRGMEEEFYIFTDPKDLATELQINMDLAKAFHHFWALKRKSRDDASLLPPTAEQQECLAGRQVKPYQRATMEVERVVRLRQDLERIRNLCYMVEKREKQKRDLTKARETVFWKELEIVEDTSGKITSQDVQWARSCCTNNFTEYEILQNLDFNYPGKVNTLKRGRGRPRRVKAQVTKCFSEEEGSSSTTVVENHRLEEKQVRGEESSNGGNDIIRSRSDEGRTTSPRIHVESETAGASSGSNSGEGVSGETCCGNVPRTTKRLQDMSSDSDFEDEPKRRVKRRHFIRRRLVKSRRKGQQKNVVMPCNETTSSSSSQSTTQLNCLRLDISKNDDIRRGVNNSNDICRSFSDKTVGRNARKNNQTALDEHSCEIDDSISEIMPCRQLRSNGAFLDGKMVLDKCDIPISPKGICLRNGIALRSKNEGNVFQNRIPREQETEMSEVSAQNLEKQVFTTRTRNREKEASDSIRRTHDKQFSDDDVRKQQEHLSDNEPEGLHEVFYRTRSRSSSGEPGLDLASRRKNATVISRRFSGDRKSASNFKLRGSLEECLVDSCRTRQCPKELRETLDTSFAKSATCNHFFDKFRQTATTSA